ncbi:MAG: hypothetical protein O2815_10420, partial [Actinomycetota bacterium]|nr:hypothetical protein [Actinomycetota bacterium]
GLDQIGRLAAELDPIPPWNDDLLIISGQDSSTPATPLPRQTTSTNLGERHSACHRKGITKSEIRFCVNVVTQSGRHFDHSNVRPVGILIRISKRSCPNDIDHAIETVKPRELLTSGELSDAVFWVESQQTSSVVDVEHPERMVYALDWGK